MRKMDKRFQKNEQLIRKYFIELLDKKKYSEITINQLCKDILISKNTFYAHYQNKDDLLKSIINELLEQIFDKFKRNHPDSSTGAYDILKNDQEVIVSEIVKNKSIYTTLFAKDAEINFSNILAFRFKQHTLNWTMFISNKETSNPKVILLLDFLCIAQVNLIKNWLLYYQNIFSKEEIIDIIWSVSQDAIIQITNLGFNLLEE